MTLKRKVSNLLFTQKHGTMCPACGQGLARDGEPWGYPSLRGTVTINMGPTECCNAIWVEVYELVGYKYLRRTKERFRKRSGSVS